MEIKVTTNEGKVIQILPGDEVFLSNGDCIVYLTGRQAEAHRLLVEDHQEKINKTIEFVKKRGSM